MHTPHCPKKLARCAVRRYTIRVFVQSVANFLSSSSVAAHKSRSSFEQCLHMAHFQYDDFHFHYLCHDASGSCDSQTNFKIASRVRKSVKPQRSRKSLFCELCNLISGSCNETNESSERRFFFCELRASQANESARELKKIKLRDDLCFFRSSTHSSPHPTLSNL